MANFDINVIENGKPKRRPSSSNTFDFLSVRIGASNITLSEASAGVLSLNGAKLTGGATPTDDTDLATRGFVLALVQGLKWKDPVRVVATTNQTLSGLPTIDDVTLTEGQRALLAGQTLPEENGIYTVSSGAWTRATDMDASSEVLNAAMLVSEGTEYADTGWTCNTNEPITLGTTGLTFVQFTGAATIVAGAGLTKTGNTLDVGAGEGIEVLADSVAWDQTKEFTNDNAGSITVRQAVYIKADGDVDLAQATVASLENFELGMVYDASIATTESGRITVRRGAVVAGFTGLTPGQKYYVARDTAGTIDLYANISWQAGDKVYSVGRAMSATELLFNPVFEFEY